MLPVHVDSDTSCKTAAPPSASLPKLDSAETVSPGVRVYGDRVDLSLHLAGLQSVLQEIGRQTGIDVITAADLPNRQVTLVLKNVALLDAFRQLLYGYTSFIRLSAQDRIEGLWIYPAGTADALKPLPSSEWASTAELVDQWSQSPTAAQKAQMLDSLVQRLGDGATSMLVDALADDAAVLRLQALDSAVNHGVALPRDLLADRLINDPETAVRLRVLDALFYPWRQQGLEAAMLEVALQAGLSDPDTSVREHAADLLAELASG